MTLLSTAIIIIAAIAGYSALAIWAASKIGQAIKRAMGE